MNSEWKEVTLEDYATDVYGSNRLGYELFNPGSLCAVILNIVRKSKSPTSYILAQQQYLKHNEISKLNNIVDVFDDVLGRKSK